MHPLNEYITKQLAEHIKSRKVIVWYDQRSEFAPFVAELVADVSPINGLCPVSVGGISAQLAIHQGSMFELRALVEPHVCGDTPRNVIIYLAGCERDRKGSVLMELEKSGECYEPQLKRLARNVLRQRYTDGVIDEMLASDNIDYQDLVRAAGDLSGSEPPSMLKSILDCNGDFYELLAAWLTKPEHDKSIEDKNASTELLKLIRSRLALEISEAPLLKIRAITIRYVLAGEFRSDLNCPPPASVVALQAPATKDAAEAVRELARRLRKGAPEAYAAMADQVEQELGLSSAQISADALGSIDTFRFEEISLLNHCGQLILAKKFDEALRLIQERERSFWVDREVSRKAQWEAYRLMAELGRTAFSVQAVLKTIGPDTKNWIESYTADDGWYLLDQAQRRLETWLGNLDEDPEERLLAFVRQSYDDACQAMCVGFTRALEQMQWTPKGILLQNQIFNEVVSSRPKPVAYFLVDAMRFEMAKDLAERLPKTTEIALRPALGSLPSITPIGMAALQPDASGSFDVGEEKGNIGAYVDKTFLFNLASRKKFAAARIPKLVDIALDELLGLPATKLAKKLEGAQVVMVRSQEIDNVGEAGFGRQARRVMNEVLGDIGNAIQRLARAGIEHAVVTADHGHLFHAADRDESMRIDSPGGQQVELHRRCWIGRGGATPAGCIRVTSRALGYSSDLDFVFPVGSGVFKAGGDLAFHHGGPSLQELIIPVLSLRTKAVTAVRTKKDSVSIAKLPDVVTNRIFTATIVFGSPQLSLGSAIGSVRPVLLSAERQVGSVGMVIDGELDKTTGCVRLEPGKPATIAFQLSDDAATSFRVVVQDPATDAELYRSPNEIPIKLGV